MNSRTRDGRLIPTYDGQGRIIQFLYRNPWGQQLTKLLIRPGISKAAGWFLDRRVSSVFVKSFIRSSGLDLSDYPQRKYRSFNDFFTRQILPERRPIDMTKNHLIAPCDSKLTVIPITEDVRFQIKGVEYTMESLLRDQSLSACYQGGTLLLFRLSVEDYHRYCYVADGEKSDNICISGVYHTVSPHAAERMPIYRENAREYSLLKTNEFGAVLMMEVGAMLVGKICNHHGSCHAGRGQEKGMFQFGGSTVVLILQQNSVEIDEDILKNSAAGEETIVKMGEKIGTAKKAPTDCCGTGL